MGLTTHTLQHVDAGRWHLRRVDGRYRSLRLTEIAAVSPERAIQLANRWLDEHETCRRGQRWARSKGWSGRFALRA